MVQATQWGVPTSGQVSPVDYATRDDASLDALLSMHKGPTPPPYATAGVEWLDDNVATAWAKKVYDGTDWYTLWVINPVTNAVSFHATAPGQIVQSVYAEVNTSANVTAIIPNDDTVPQITEGTQIISASITPTNVANKLRVRVLIPTTSPSVGTFGVAALFKGSGVNAVKASFLTAGNAAVFQSTALEHEEAAGSTSAVTFATRVGPTTAATFTINGAANVRRLGGAAAVTMVIEEIKA